MVADILASRWGEESGWRKADNATYLEKRMPEKCYLIKPTTYMNNSGGGSGGFCQFLPHPPEEVLVIRTIWICWWVRCGFAAKGPPGATMV